MTARLISVQLAKGYLAGGQKYCWGYDRESSHGAGLHNSLTAAQSAVRSRRYGGWGIMWTITHHPVCVARGRRAALVFSVSSYCSQLPRVSSVKSLCLGHLLRGSLSWRPTAVPRAELEWEAWEPPYCMWSSKSRGGALPLSWHMNPIDHVHVAPGTLDWLADLEARLTHESSPR
jgi:hypothetical protein